MIPYARQSIDKDDIKAVSKVLKSDFLSSGPKVLEFEKALSKFTGAKYCLSLSSATAALHLSSLSLLKKNAKVLTSPISFLATSNSLLYIGAKPIFIDIDKNANIDLKLCEKRLKKEKDIKGIYLVSMAGKLYDIEYLLYLKKKYSLLILEDLSHAIGSIYTNGFKAGSCISSDISVFSFHAIKNISTAEGGAITTNNKKLYEKIKILRNHGIVKDHKSTYKYKMKSLGFNYRLNDISSALGISQLKRINTFIEKKHNLVKNYIRAFKDSKNIKVLYKFDKNSSYHLFLVKVKFKKIKKEELFKELLKKGIKIQVHYIPINSQTYYKKLAYDKKETPKALKYYKSIISLPLFYELSFEKQNYIIKSVKELLE